MSEWITHTIRPNPLTTDEFTIDAPINIYTHSPRLTATPTLSVYGKGYVDGATARHYRMPMHPSIKLSSSDSDSRRAYVIGYTDGYNSKT
jgi:hypothetical protein